MKNFFITTAMIAAFTTTLLTATETTPEPTDPTEEADEYSDMGNEGEGFTFLNATCEKVLIEGTNAFQCADVK